MGMSEVWDMAGTRERVHAGVGHRLLELRDDPGEPGEALIALGEKSRTCQPRQSVHVESGPPGVLLLVHPRERVGYEALSNLGGCRVPCAGANGHLLHELPAAPSRSPVRSRCRT